MRLRADFRGWWVATLLLVLPLGCKQSPGTFVILQFTGSVATDQTLFGIDVDLDLATRRDSTSFKAADGAHIDLPTSATLIIQSGEGQLTVSARALDKNGNVVGTGTGSGRVQAGQNTTIEVHFSSAGLDGGSGGPEAGTGKDAPEESPIAFGGMDGGSLGGEAGMGAGGTGTGGAAGMGAGGASTGGATGFGTDGLGTDGAVGTYPLSLSISTLNFGSVPVGSTSGPQTITVTNTGTVATLPLTVFVADGTHFPISPGGCGGGSILKPGDGCALSFSFTPASSGPAQTNGSVGPAGGPPVSFTLIGTGGTPPLTLSPTSVDFKVLNVGVATAVPFTVTNNSSASLIGPDIVLSGSAAFQATNNTCASSVLGPQGHCTFNLGFAPTAVGPASTTIVAQSGSAQSATSSATGTGAKTVQLTIQFAGAGTGSVTWTGASIHSASTYSTGFTLTDPNSVPQLNLTAMPDGGSKFVGWTGDCTGPGACVFAMTTDRTVTVNFAPASATD